MTNDIIPAGVERDRLKQALGLAWQDPDNIDSIAASFGFEPGMLLNLLSTDEGVKVAIVAESLMRDDGSLLKRQTLKPLEKLVARVEALIDAGEVSVGSAPRLLDVLFKMSGLAEERASRLRVEAERDKPMATIIILHAGDPDPEPAQPGQARIVIDLRGKDRQNRVVNVTPDDEGGE